MNNFGKIYRNTWGILAFFLSLSFSQPLWAGGAIAVDLLGRPLLWDTQSVLYYHPENGVLSSNLGVAGSLDLVEKAFGKWASISGVELQIAQGGMLPSIDANNYSQYFAGKEACYPSLFPEANGDCFTPIIFDEDGSIIDAMFGAGASNNILGFAGPDDVLDESGDPERRIVRRGQALFSGACLPPTNNGCQRALTTKEMSTVIFHEVGHLLGMDHSQVNPEAYLACSSSSEGCPPEFVDSLPAMFPILTFNANMDQLHADDIATFRSLYGDPLNYGCSVSGNVYARDVNTTLRGAEVVAINVRPSLAYIDRVATVSGAYAPKRSIYSRRQGNCTENCGQYEITGLQPGQSYQICVQKILPQFTGGSSIEPVDPPFQGFSNECFQDLVISCECPPNELCQDYSGVDLITDADPESIDDGTGTEPYSEFGEQASGGCSLIKPRVRPTYFWRKLQESFPIENSAQML